jgi:glyceraldehyde 3-phosphate dehydrogenase
MPNVAINGLGRIGRAALKILLDADGLDLVAVNDIADVDNLAYLLKYDTVYGRYHRAVATADGALLVDGRRIAAFAERDPANLPWADLGVDLVLECTGVFKTEDGLRKHIHAGASYVILSAPTTAETVPTVVHGVNRPAGEPQIISCASCTTNCITPVIEIAHRHIGVQRAVMTTIHAYTAGQQLVDGPATSFRRGRAGAANLVPTSTGAAGPPPARYPSWPGGSTESRCAPPSRSGRSPTSCSSQPGRPPRRRSTTRSGRRRHPSNIRGFSASRRIRWSPPTSSATHAPPSSTST